MSREAKPANRRTFYSPELYVEGDMISLDGRRWRVEDRLEIHEGYYVYGLRIIFVSE